MMALRFLGYSLLLGVFALMSGSMLLPATTQATEKQTLAPRWEYKVLKLDANQCSLEDQVDRSLNAAGEEGWELISYERLMAAFPRDAEGDLLIRPAATGPGRANNPQTADSFQGTITMKMAQTQPGACRLLFKRPAPAVVKR